MEEPMEQTEAVRRPVLPTALIGLGGVVMAIGAILPFARVGAGNLPIPSQTVSGLDTADGKLYLGVGIALIVLAILLWVSRSSAPRIVVAVLAILGAGFMLVAGIIDITNLESEGLDAIAAQAAEQTPGVTEEQVRAALEQFNVTIDPGYGLYVVIAGAALGLIGGAAALFTRGERMAAAVAPPPPPSMPSEMPSEDMAPPPPMMPPEAPGGDRPGG